MSEKSLSQDIVYEAALLQFQPRASSEERVNVGVFLFSPETLQIDWRVSEKYARLTALFPDLDGQAYRSMVRHVERRLGTLRGKGASPDQSVLLEGTHAIADLLARVVPATVTNFGWSSIRFGRTDDLKARTKALFDEYIGSLEGAKGRARVDDRALWERVRGRASFQEVAARVEEAVTLKTSDYEYTFRAGWNNGHRQVAEPISLDYLKPAEMVEEANKWTGRLVELGRENDFEMTAIITDAPIESQAARRKYEQAEAILSRSPRVRHVIRQAETDQLAELITKDLKMSH